MPGRGTALWESVGAAGHGGAAPGGVGRDSLELLPMPGSILTIFIPIIFISIPITLFPPAFPSS